MTGPVIGPADLPALYKAGYGSVSMCLWCSGRGRQPSGAHPSGYERCQACEGAGRVVTTGNGLRPYRDDHPRAVQ